jgi:hypothetical protein
MRPITLEEIKKHYYACGDCLTAAGGVFPAGHICTVSAGDCPICGAINVTLIPWVDFNFPKDAKNNYIAKRNRD